MPGMSTPFTPDVVEAIKRHMNDDHADDALLIVRSLGGRPEATAATTSDVDAEAIEFAAVVDGDEVTVRVPWGRTLTERAEVRREVVRLYREACAALGVPARGEH
ncbi:heme iron utilization protein [Planomonospora sphaerica]|uniref:Heme iron utilization protein n=2 Tax=Streptosporangiaceae TaxID=2004 RepID=A0A161LK86_9ACTN|nr:heme iron utilization protein [Planomonospora sphaerica]